MTGNEPYWVVQGIIRLELFDYTLLLYGKKDPVRGSFYEGDLFLGDEGLNLSKMSSLFLEKTFHLTLPDFLPDLVLNSVSICIHPEPGTFAVKANATADIHNPFGTSDSGLKFQDLQISWATGNKVAVTANASGYTGRGKWPVGKVFFYFSNDRYAFGMSLDTKVWKTADLFSILTDQALPDSIADVLPVISSESEQKPIQIYQSNEAWSESGQNWKKGFNLTGTKITLFSHYSFLVNINISEKNLYLTARALPFTIFNLVRISRKKSEKEEAWGASLTADTRSGNLKIEAGFYFFPDAAETFCVDTDLVYNYKEKAFTTRISLPETTLQLGLSWSEKEGFRITDFPGSVLDKLSDVMKWGELIRKFCNRKGSSACEKFADIPELKTPKLTTKFNLDYKAENSSEEKIFKLRISGSCSIKANGKELDKVPIEPFTLEVKYPSSLKPKELPECIFNAMKDNVENIAIGLWNNKEFLSKFLARFMLNKVGEELKRLFCSMGKKIFKEFLKKLIDVAMEAITEKTIESLAEAAAVFAAATGILSLFTWFTDWSGEDRKKKKEAEKAKKEAEEKINKWLHIDSGSMAYQEDFKGMRISWKGISAPMDNKVTFIITINYASGETVTKKMQRDKAQEYYAVLIPRSELIHPSVATATVHAYIREADTDFNGNRYGCGPVDIPGGVGYDEIETDFKIN